MESAVVARDHTGHGAKRTVFDGGISGVIYGDYLRRLFTGVWPLWSAATTGQRPLRVDGHYGSTATTGQRPLRVSGHYGSVRGVGDVAPYG